MDLTKLFHLSFRVWLACFTFINIVSLIFMDIRKDDITHEYTYATMVTNIFLHYLLITFLWLLAQPAYYSLPPPTADQLIQTKPPGFYEWVWHCSNPWIRVSMVMTFSIWLIPNFILCFYLSGLGYLLVMFFAYTLIYWLSIFTCMGVSYWRRDQVTYL